MGKAAEFQDLSLNPPSGNEELWRWLYGELRNAILSGRLKRGTRVPSSRSLAAQYGISRGTVSAAFDHLRSEGYLDSEVGSGTFVATRLPEESMPLRSTAVISARSAADAGISRRGSEAVRGVVTLPASHSLGKAFRSYEPAIDLFPAKLWSRTASRVLRNAPRSLYGQGDPQGYLPLRRAIADYAGTARGVTCDAGQILITSGAQQALDLISRTLLDVGDQAWVEDPGYPGAVFALRAAGVNIVAVPVDENGMDVKSGVRRAPNARLAYVTPANQMPLGVTMSLERRLALLDWARVRGSWIVEDEYDAEYRYFGRPLAALQSLDRGGSVIYVGTFTKLLFNSLRLGFMVLPPRLIDAFTKVRSFVDRHPPTLEQAILTEFILEGHFGHHVRRMREIYAERSSVLVEAAQRYVGGALSVVRAVSGMRSVGWLQTGEPAIGVAQRAWAQGLEVAAVSQFARQPYPKEGLILGFAACNEAEITRGFEVLASVIR